MTKPQHLSQSRHHRQIACHFYCGLVLRRSVTWTMGRRFWTPQLHPATLHEKLEDRPYKSCKSFWMTTCRQSSLHPALKTTQTNKTTTHGTHGSSGKKYFGDILEPSLNILRSKFGPNLPPPKKKNRSFMIYGFSMVFQLCPRSSHLDRQKPRIPSRHHTTAHLHQGLGGWQVSCWVTTTQQLDTEIPFNMSCSVVHNCLIVFQYLGHIAPSPHSLFQTQHVGGPCH